MEYLTLTRARYFKTSLVGVWVQSSSPKRGLKIRYYILYAWVNGYVTAQFIDDIEKVMSKNITFNHRGGEVWKEPKSDHAAASCDQTGVGGGKVKYHF